MFKFKMSQIYGKMQKLLILKTLKQNPMLYTSEIYEIIKLNGIEDFSYDLLGKVISNLLREGLLEKEDRVYKITDAGKKELQILSADLENIVMLLREFKATGEILEKKEAVSLDKVYAACRGVKLIPYTVRYFIKEDEDRFFLKELPKNNNVYEFEGRGLGTGDFSNYVIAFQNNNYIKYVAVLDRYVNLNNEKKMYLKEESVHKLSVPISGKDMLKVDAQFRFIRNKQTMDDSSKVEKFIDLLRIHW